MPAFFITATGTDIGKTFLAAALIRHLRRAGHAVEAIKPVVSGFDPLTADMSDPGVLLAALGRLVTPDAIERMSPWRFKQALAPDMAARREGRPIDFDAVVTFSNKAVAAAGEFLFIEGVGGVMVPLDDHHTVLDWMTALRLPLILVAGSYLGTISHTLTALDAIAHRRLHVAALMINETAGSTVPLDDTLATVARYAQQIPVFGLPRLPHGETEHTVFARVIEQLGQGAP